MFSMTGEYALKALVYIAQQESGAPIPGRVISESLGIPRKYLSGVLRDLVTAGVLRASPGRTGGFRLARDPRRISLSDVLAPFERVMGVRPGCPFGTGDCDDANPCPGHHVWSALRTQMAVFLNDTSLQDVSISSPKDRKNGGAGRRSRRN